MVENVKEDMNEKRGPTPGQVVQDGRDKFCASSAEWDVLLGGKRTVGGPDPST